MSKNQLDTKNILADLIQEILGKGKIVDFKALVSHIKYTVSKSSLNINDDGIKHIIKSLLENNYIVQGSRLTRNNVLNNLNRKKIHDTIIQNPGLYRNKLAKKLQLSNHVVGWHVNILLKFNFIKKEMVNKHEIYYDSTLNSINTKVCYLLAKNISQEIINYILYESNIGITKTRISNTLNIHYSIIGKYINDLEEVDILEKKKLPNQTLYFLNETLYNKLNNVII